MIFSGWRHITDHFALLLPQFPSVDLFLAASSSLLIPGGVYSLQGHNAARSKLFSGNSQTLDQLDPFSPLNLSQTLNWVVSFGFPEIIISDTVLLSTNCIVSSTGILCSLRSTISWAVYSFVWRFWLQRCFGALQAEQSQTIWPTLKSKISHHCTLLTEPGPIKWWWL